MRWKPRANTRFRRATDVKTSTSPLLVVSLLGPALCFATPVESGSTCSPIAPGGELVVTRFLGAPVPRAHEILADAMQAAGVVLYTNTEESIEGERVAERIKVLRLPGGDEAVQATLAAATEDGKSGAQIRVETMRHSFKKGAPKQSWSTAVMNHAACLLTLLSVDDPRRRPLVPVVDGMEVHVPASTPLEVRSRHFFFNTEVKIGQPITFETTAPVVIGGVTAIPAGSLVVAAMQGLHDSKSFGRAAEGQLVFKYVVAPDGTRLPLRGEVDFTGKNTLKKGVAAEAGTIAVGVVFLYFAHNSGPLGDPLLGEPGLGFAVPAGTMTTLQFDGEQTLRVNRSAAPAGQENR